MRIMKTLLLLLFSTTFCSKLSLSKSNDKCNHLRWVPVVLCGVMYVILKHYSCYFYHENNQSIPSRCFV